jgi:hypothetical protein
MYNNLYTLVFDKGYLVGLYVLFQYSWVHSEKNYSISLRTGT